jgi:hypothetical protein
VVVLLTVKVGNSATLTDVPVEVLVAVFVVLFLGAGICLVGFKLS